MEAPQSKPKNGMAVASLILGIIGAIFSFIPVFGAYVAIPLGIIGLILGIVATKKAGKSGMTTAGIVLSIIAIALGVIFYVACVACVAGLNGAVNDALNEAASSIN